MPYTEAVLLEHLRFSNGPMGVLHETTCETEVQGFFVPKGMTVCIIMARTQTANTNTNTTMLFALLHYQTFHINIANFVDCNSIASQYRDWFMESALSQYCGTQSLFIPNSIASQYRGECLMFIFKTRMISGKNESITLLYL